MKVLIDGNGLQARTHAQDGKRLQTFLERLEDTLSCVVCLSPEGALNSKILAGCEVLVITTRKGDINPYSAEELTLIPDFVRQGGGLLLMSNHGDVPGRYPIDLTKQDSILASRLGVGIETAFFANREPNELSELSGSALLATHPIMRGAAGASPIRSIFTINCCSIVSSGSAPLVTLSNQMIDHRNGYAPDGRCFAVALDADGRGTPEFKGRVVVAADSGFIGTEGTTYPGPGLIEHGDNLRFVQNIIRWLGCDLS